MLAVKPARQIDLELIKEHEINKVLYYALLF